MDPIWPVSDHGGGMPVDSLIGSNCTIQRKESESDLSLHGAEIAMKIGLKEELVPMLMPRLLSYRPDGDIKNMGVFSVVPYQWIRHAKSDSAVSRLHHQQLVDARMEITCIDNLERLKCQVIDQLKRISDEFKDMESFALQNGDNVCFHSKNAGKELDERFEGLKLLLTVVFDQIRIMFGLAHSLIINLQFEHELQGGISNILMHDCIRDFKEKHETTCYEQNKVMNAIEKERQSAHSKLKELHDELDFIYKLLFLPEHRLEDRNDAPLLSWSDSLVLNREWSKGKYTLIEGGSEPELLTLSDEECRNLFRWRSANVEAFVTEKSDLGHLNSMPKEEVVRYFKVEISKLKRQHEIALQEVTEELFKLKRDKGFLDSKREEQFELLRTKIPVFISIADELVKSKMVPLNFSIDNYNDELSQLKAKVDALYDENKSLRGLLLDKSKEIEQLSSQLSDRNGLLQQIAKTKDECINLHLGGKLKEIVYQVVTSTMAFDYSNAMDDVTTSLVTNHNKELSALKVILIENEKALILANEENRKLKEQLAAQDGSVMLLRPEQFQEDWHEDIMHNNETDKQVIHSSTENVLNIFDDETDLSTLQCELEVHELSNNLESISNAVEDAQKESTIIVDINDNEHKALLSFASKEKEVEKQLELIMMSLMGLFKDILGVEDKLSNSESDHWLDPLDSPCNCKVQHAITIAKKCLCYKQMLEERCSKLQKAKAEADLLADNVGYLLSLLGKMHSTVDQYADIFQQYPALLVTFLKTGKLVGELRYGQRGDAR